MASRKIEDCVPQLQAAWQQALIIWEQRHPNVKPFLTCTYRSPQEQDALYALGRTKKGNIVTNARAGQSKHNSKPSKAFDVAFKNPDGSVEWGLQYFKEFAAIIKQIDPAITWGGSFRTIKDAPHWEV